MLTHLFLKLTLIGAEWVLWVLLVLSLISIALIVERLLFFNRTSIDGETLREQLNEHLTAGNLRAAWDLVQQPEIIECEVVAAGLAAVRRGTQACSEAMLSAKARMKPELDARLSILATIGSNAPFIGLLGTVLGIVKAAHDLGGAGGEGNPSAVMSGVFEALVATAVGLCVAIPAVVAYNLLQRRVRTRLSQVDTLAHLVLSTARSEPGRAGAAPTNSSSTTPVASRIS